MLLRLQGEGVHVDADVLGHVLVVLERLHQVEVGAGALSEAVLAVQLQLGLGHGVDGTVATVVGGVVSPVVGTAGTQHLVALNHPDQLLNWVIEVQLDLGVQASDGLVTGELQLLDQVLVRELSKAAALIGVQEDVVDPQGAGRQVTGDAVGGAQGGGAVLQQVADGLEVDVNLDLMVLHQCTKQSVILFSVIPDLSAYLA